MARRERMPDHGNELPKKQGYRETAGTGKKPFFSHLYIHMAVTRGKRFRQQDVRLHRTHGERNEWRPHPLVSGNAGPFDIQLVSRMAEQNHKR
jgi:hypothetical protein